MADQNPRDRYSLDPFSSPSDDIKTQGAVLLTVLSGHPAQFTVAELTRELTEDPDDSRQRDVVKRAVRDLAGVGLLHRQGIFVLPSRVALYYERLGVVA